jgi:Tol biopolymer transport system component
MIILPPLESPAGKIVVQSDRNGNQEIYTMTATGANQTRLTNNNASNDHPDW